MVEVPSSIQSWADQHDYQVEDVIWRAPHGAVTVFLSRADHPALFAKWSTDSLLDEAEHVSWLSGRFAAPRAADYVSADDGDVLITYALAGRPATELTDQPDLVARALGEGLATLHQLDPADSMFGHPEWIGPQESGDPLAIIHGDARVANLLVNADGGFAGFVDLSDLGVGDPAADLAAALWSLDNEFGPGHAGAFWEAYGEELDEQRIARYTELFLAHRS